MSSGRRSCTPEECYSNLWQFKCESCPGKFEHHEYHMWHARVKNGVNPLSKCKKCKRKVPAIPRGEEEGVKICHFVCTTGDTYVVRCTMQDTAPCYKCRDKGHDEEVVPCHFEPLRRIKRKTDATHNCSKCHGSGNCPNMMNSRRKEGKIKLDRGLSQA